MLSSEGFNTTDPVVVLSFGDVGQTVANMLSSPALGRPVPYVVFDLTVARVQAAQECGFNVLYGDGSRSKARLPRGSVEGRGGRAAAPGSLARSSVELRGPACAACPRRCTPTPRPHAPAPPRCCKRRASSGRAPSS